MQEATSRELEGHPSRLEHQPAVHPFSGWDERLAHHILQGAGRPGIALSLWNGARAQTGSRSPAATFRIADRGALWRLGLDPALQFGELYTAGRITLESGDLVAGLREILAANPPGTPLAPTARLARYIAAVRPKAQALARAQAPAHYDLGNDFYRLWLDPTLSYTCAYFTSAAATLQEAQLAKLDHVCRKVGLQAGSEVVEAGSGWGSLALHAASRYGAKVKSYNVSREQVNFARARARSAGLEGRVEFSEEDSRNATGRCDAFLSVGMLEHVGPAHYPELGQLARRLLRPDGFGLIHTIGRVTPEAVDPWIRKRVFPGTYVPSLAELMAVFEPNGLAVTDVENLRPHYARTLALWLGNFERQRAALSRHRDAAFLRLWQLYLAGSCAAFEAGRMQLYQVAFTSPANRKAPWTRESLYEPDARTWEWTAAMC